MGNFFSSLISGYAGATLQRKQQEQAREDSGKAAEVNALSMAVGSGRLDDSSYDAAMNRIQELTSTKGKGGGKGAGNQSPMIRQLADKLRGKIAPEQQYDASQNPKLNYKTGEQMDTEETKRLKTKSDIDVAGKVKEEQARVVADKPTKLGTTTRDGKVYNIWRHPDGVEEEIEDVAATDKSKGEEVKRRNENAQVELRNAQKDFEKSRNDPNSPSFKLAFDRLQVAKQNSALAAKRQVLQEASYELRRDIADRPVAATRARADQARLVQGTIDHTEDLIDQLGDQLGPVIGRKNLLDVKIGDVDPSVRGLKTNLDSIAQMLGLLHGYRGGAQLSEQFHETVGDLSTNPEALEDSLEEIRGTAQRIIDVAGKGQGLTAPEKPLGDTDSSSSNKSGHKIGDVIDYQGKQMRIKAIRPDNKVVLEPAGSK